MNRPIATRVLENVNKYTLIVNPLEPKHPEFSELIHLVKLVIHGLAKYYTLFILDQHEKVVRVARIEDDYSRNVTLIGRRLRTWAKYADLTLKGKMVLDQLYLVLQRCLRDALELYTESERELMREGPKIYMSASDAYGEYERANAALWKFQNAFHLHQIDFSRGSSDRGIIFGQATYAGPPAGFGNFEFVTREWQEPDRNNMNNFTEEEQERLRALLSAPKVQTLLPEELRDPNISLSPVRDDDDDGRKKILPFTIYPHRFMHKLKGVLKTPKFEPPRRKPKKTVNFESSEHSPLPDDNVHSTRGRGGCIFIVPEDMPSRPPPTNGSKKRPFNPADQTFDIPTDPYRPPLPPHSSGSPKPAGTTTPIPVESVTPGGSDSSEDSSVSDGTVEKITIADVIKSVISPASSSSSSSLPSVGSLSPKRTPSPTEDGDGGSTASNSPEEEDSDGLPTSPTSTECDEISLARPAEEVRREVALSVRAYLGRRLDEYGVALATDPDIDSAEDDEEDGPRDEDYAAHHPLRRSARDQSARYVTSTALLHWAGVGKAKREERINGYTRLRAILKWAEGEGRVPLSPSSIRASTGLRRGLFEPLGPPDLPAPKKLSRRKRRRQAGPGPYREATLAGLAQLQPRLDVSLMAFLANQDALRVFGGLVGETPQPRDLARMDRLLRELVSDFPNTDFSNFEPGCLCHVRDLLHCLTYKSCVGQVFETDHGADIILPPIHHAPAGS